ncbi:MAG: hypothetical protein JRG90_12570 [Deltaproteobacteria bacterium]|nr:hypothetical protein [Deltaproteobacteria bacterium]
MANHRRGRAKNQRAGCLLCKPHKGNGVNDPPPAVRRAFQRERKQIESDMHQADWVMDGDYWDYLDDELYDTFVRYRAEPLRVNLIDAARLR